MAATFTMEELEQMGYREIRPNHFAKVAPAQKIAPKKKKHASAAAYAGHYDVGDKTYKFRSGWEYIYAEYLEFCLVNGEIAEWDYECQTFEFKEIKRGTRFYLPDFKVTMKDGTHWWAEVKGYMDKKSNTKLKRMAKYYPEEKITLIQRKEINIIKESGIIPKEKLLMMAAKG